MTNAATVDAAVRALPPDTRNWARVSVRDLVIDSRLQRTRDEGEVDKIANQFDWAKFETPTVVADMTNPQRMLVIEGQRRVLAVSKLDPDAIVTVCHLGVLPVSAVAQVVHAIAKSRKRHSAYDQWNLLVLAGSEHEILAEVVIADRGLHLGLNASAVTIAAVATVKAIIHHYRDPALGAEHLGDILDVALSAFPKPDPESPHVRFDHNLLAALSHLLRQNRHADLSRIAEKLQERPAQYWLAEVLSNGPREPRHIGVARSIASAYNKHLRVNLLEW